MKEIPITPMVNSFFSSVPNDAIKLLTDRKKLFLREVNILQESYVVYRSEASSGICFSFRDYGVRDIKNIGFTLILETKRHTFKFQKSSASVSYINDNQFKIHIIDLQRIPIVSCYLIFDWILYMDTPLQFHESGKIQINSQFERLIKSDSENMNRINKARENCVFDRNRSTAKKGVLPEESIATAWTLYDELRKPFQNLQRSIEYVEQNHNDLHLMPGGGNDSDLIAVPISCYFDKGFYSTLYYAQNYPIIEKRLSGGKSAVQCVVGVNKTHLDVLLYLFYCTIDQRNYYQYLTDEQIQLQKYLENKHPIMRMKKELSNLVERYPNCEIVLKSNLYISAQAVVDEYFMKLKCTREGAYNDLVKKKRTHGKWVNEYKLFTLVRVIFPDAEYQYSADWLEHQVLDIYIPSINCAIEYQGEQHYQPVEYFGGEQKLLSQEEMYQIKRKKCEEHGVLLLEWPYSLQIHMPSLCTFLRGSVPEDSIADSTLEVRIATFPIENLSEFLNYAQNKRNVAPSPKQPRVSKFEIRKFDAAGKYLKSYPSVSDAAETEKLSVGGINKVIYGERKTAGGFQWKRCEIDSEKADISPIE